MNSGEDLERRMGPTIFYQEKPRVVSKSKVEIEKPPKKRFARKDVCARYYRHID